MGGIVTRNM